MTASPNIDYRALLIKYINHVVKQESITYLSPWRKPDWISEDEWAELLKLADEPMP